MISIINYKKIYVLIIIVSFCFATDVGAQERADSAIKQEFEQTFQKMLEDPANVDIALKYAQLAVSLGNYEAAIPPLERILIFNPNLPKIKLELGVLYYKLDSMKMAKSYFEGAAVSKDATDEIKNSANEYLQKIKR